MPLAKALSVGLQALGLLAALPALAAPDAAPVNLAPNSQWEIFSGLTFSAKWNVEGTGPMSAISASANSVGLSRVTFAVSGPTGELKVGDLITVAGTGVDPVLLRSPMRVVALTPDLSVTVVAPLGLAPQVSRPSRLQAVNIGGEASGHTGDAADRWSKSVPLIVWREDNPANLSSGALYALGAHKDQDGPESISMELDPARYRGRTLVFGALVRQKARSGSGTWKVFFASGGSRGSYVTGSAAAPSRDPQWLEMSYVVPADATSLSLGVELDGARGDTYYVTDPVLTVGTAIGRDNYVKPTETFIPIVHVSPWVNATLHFQPARDAVAPPYCLFDLYAESGGQIAPTVKMAEGAIEGVNDNPVTLGMGPARVLSFTNSPFAPNLFSPILGQPAKGVKAFGPVAIPLDGQGRAWFTSGVIGDTWYNVSIDLEAFLLQ